MDKNLKKTNHEDPQTPHSLFYIIGTDSIWLHANQMFLLLSKPSNRRLFLFLNLHLITEDDLNRYSFLRLIFYSFLAKLEALKTLGYLLLLKTQNEIL